MCDNHNITKGWRRNLGSSGDELSPDVTCAKTFLSLRIKIIIPYPATLHKPENYKFLT